MPVRTAAANRLAWMCVVTSGCDGDFPRRLPLSTSPGEATAPPVIVVQPQPRQFPPFEITTIAVGDVISRTNIDAPECIRSDRWPCLYFRLVAPGTGTLEVTLTYIWGTQGSQSVDVSLREVGTFSDVWAQAFSETGLRRDAALSAPVLEGRTYDITLWYTFPNLEYELQTSLRQ
jgi:hypothetical protein